MTPRPRIGASRSYTLREIDRETIRRWQTTYGFRTEDAALRSLLEWISEKESRWPGQAPAS